MRKADLRPLYASRKVANADQLLRWAKEQGFRTTLPAGDLHVTIAFSRTPLDWFAVGEAWSETVTVLPGGPRAVEPLGDKGAVVLKFKSSELEARWQQFRDAGASWDYDGYQPHVTLTYDPGDLDLAKVEPYLGKLEFGPEIFAPLDEDWADKVTEKRDGIISPMDYRTTGQITKLDEELRLAYGWFSVIEENGQAVVDRQGDVIGEATLRKAAHDFIVDARAGKVMHRGKRVADIVDSIVLTKEVQKALGIDLGKVGWFGAMRFRDEDAWRRVKSGELAAFSIGGHAETVDL